VVLFASLFLASLTLATAFIHALAELVDCLRNFSIDVFQYYFTAKGKARFALISYKQRREVLECHFLLTFCHCRFRVGCVILGLGLGLG
jgi:hypothetical protein